MRRIFLYEQLKRLLRKQPDFFFSLLHSVFLTGHSLFAFATGFLLLFKTVAVTTAAVKMNATKMSKYFFITHCLNIQGNHFQHSILAFHPII